MFIQLQLGDSLLNELVEDTSMELSSFKQVVFGIASMNAPKIVINALFNTVNVSIAARIIITPIITGFIIISSKQDLYIAKLKLNHFQQQCYVLLYMQQL